MWFSIASVFGGQLNELSCGESKMATSQDKLAACQEQLESEISAIRDGVQKGNELHKTNSCKPSCQWLNSGPESCLVMTCTYLMRFRSDPKQHIS
jgi:hypothetical protein